ncbi:hypothetical protein IFM89_027074 [Coptis chinensis]|uniref:PPM-type phosphatase domain-containing protein n=1 Tax=Coptis chinensis TaxID=261450 RepID=A0A835HQA4_9MAGN|nr:hypothetical protein IFM89_027074 [Coptis chinensis]
MLAHTLKPFKDLGCKQQKASPDIYQVALASDTEFLLLASDGLWDYVNSVLVKLWHMRSGEIPPLIHKPITVDKRTDWENLAPQQQNFVWELSQAFATISIVSIGIWVTYFLSL